jgi:hypothetical protein
MEVVDGIRRDESIHIKVNHVEKQALHVLASLEKRNPSEMLRELLREGLKNRDLDLVSISNVDSGNHPMVTA